MYLYSVTLQPPTAICQAVYGNFSGPKAQEICVARGRIIELFRPDESKRKLVSIHSQEVFGIVRKIIPFRLTGLSKDFLVVGSDSGRIVILEYQPELGRFEKIHQEAYGKSGVRRTVPGDFVAGDPKGRAVMLGGAEKMKFVYILNRDSENKMTISSPLEAHKAHTVLFDMIALDVGYDNPLFACLEVDFGETDSATAPIMTGKYTKLLTLYEMDLGLNHVVRKFADPVDESAHHLIAVPGTPDGPGGVLICSHNMITYRKIGQPEVKCPIPHRNDSAKAPQLFTLCSTTHRTKDFFFFLVQSNFGDLYKIQLKYTGESVHGIVVQYFDTIPPANSVCVLRNGFLFAASECGNHGLYKFKGNWEEDEKAARAYSTMPPETIVTFNPRKLRNLVMTDELYNASLMTQMKIEDLAGEGEPQIYATCGRAERSALRVFRHGLAISERAKTGMPGKPLGVWTLKKTYADKYDAYMIVSFPNATLVLSIGEKVAEVPNSGFDSAQQTLHVGLLDDGSMIQVCSNKIRHIRPNGKIVMWQTAGMITHATSNERQLVVSLQGGELIYFELDQVGQLAEVDKKLSENDTVCLAIGPIPEGRQRSRFLAVGETDKTVKILSLDPEACLSRISMQALPGALQSVCLVEMRNSTYRSEEPQLYLHVGLGNGVLLRTAVDAITGALSDSRTRFLGTKPVQLFKATINGGPGMIALSSRTWLCYTYMSKYIATPLTSEAFDYACNFSSELCPEGIVGISGNSLKIVAPERLGEMFNQTIIPLRYTPRKLLTHNESHNMVILEADHGSFSFEERKKIKEEILAKNPDEEFKELDERLIGYPRAPDGKWASCVTVFSPKELKVLERLEFAEGEVALSCALVTFAKQPGQQFLVVGTAKDFTLHPQTCSAAFISLYNFADGGKKLELHYKMPVEEVPLAFLEFQGLLLAGVGNILRLYDIGKKKLLKKCENKVRLCDKSRVELRQRH